MTTDNGRINNADKHNEEGIINHDKSKNKSDRRKKIEERRKTNKDRRATQMKKT